MSNLSSANGSVQVICRVRPALSDRTAGSSSAHCASVVADAVSVVGKTIEVFSDATGAVNHFKFDGVLGAGSPQSEVYEVAAQHLVEGVLDGYDGALLCYGQTGAGKTYTLEGSLDDGPRAGILPQVAHHLFEEARQLSDDVVVTVSFVEIYLERIKDLLADRNDPAQRTQNGDMPSLGIREMDDRGPRVQGCHEIEVSSPRDIIKLARVGASHRHVAETRMNDRSSRSHSIFSITVSHVDPHDGRVFSGTLHLVDLAGSERQQTSKAEGRRLEEARTINRSLSTLGDVISALAPGQGDRKERLSHIPYRNSKLTWLLREALGGSAQAVLLVAISPSMADRQETVSSLRFGSRAMCMDNRPVAHVSTPLPRVLVQGSASSRAKPEEHSLAGAAKLAASAWRQASVASLGSASTMTCTPSTSSLGLCTPELGLCTPEQASSPSDPSEPEKMAVADALLQVFGGSGNASFDSDVFAQKFLSLRQHVIERNLRLQESASQTRRAWDGHGSLSHRACRWHASIAWDFGGGSEPKLRAQLFETSGADEDGQHRLMMEICADEFMALPVSPNCTW